MLQTQNLFCFYKKPFYQIYRVLRVYGLRLFLFQLMRSDSLVRSSFPEISVVELITLNYLVQILKLAKVIFLEDAQTQWYL